MSLVTNKQRGEIKKRIEQFLDQAGRDIIVYIIYTKMFHDEKHISLQKMQNMISSIYIGIPSKWFVDICMCVQTLRMR